MFNSKKNLVVLVVCLMVAVISGCQRTVMTDEGGSWETFVGWSCKTTSTPSMSTVSLGGKEVTEDDKDKVESFSKSRSEVTWAMAMRNKISNTFEGPGDFTGNNAVSNDANRLLNRK